MRESDTKRIAKMTAKSAAELKAVDVKVLDLENISSFTDFFVICSGTSDRHVQSIADRILMDQKKNNNIALGIEGHEKGEWILIDYGSVVVHVFHPEVREFYNIERLWGDAALLSIKGVTT